jgi:hypothetical protein
VEFRTLSHDDGQVEPGVWVIRTSEAWAWYWDLAHQNHDPVPAAPALAPDEMAVVVALGLRGSGGYGVRIDRLAEEAGVLHVFATESRPGPAAFVTEAETFPAHAVATADRALRLRLTLDVVDE